LILDQPKVSSLKHSDCFLELELILVCAPPQRNSDLIIAVKDDKVTLLGFEASHLQRILNHFEALTNDLEHPNGIKLSHSLHHGTLFDLVILSSLQNLQWIESLVDLLKELLLLGLPV
jgi:hypothetical protein